MPNYVQNQITSTSPHIEQLWEAIKGKDCLLDFNRIIPMPPSLQIESSSMMELSFAAEVYRRDGIIFSALQTDYKKGRQDHESMKAYLHRLEQQKRIDKKLGETAYQNQRQYGYTDWYGWAVAHWGTKWNAMDVVMTDPDHTLSFQTAWAAPIPVIRKLAAMFPDSTITHMWADEDIGTNCGWMRYANGVRQEEYLATPHSSEAYKIYETCWGPSPCLYTDDQGHRQYHGCEGCHNCDAAV
jgi:hypothetical protein